MTAPRIPLWAVGLAAWAVTATVVAIVTTPAGCDQDAIATAIAWGGVPGIALIATDVVRRREIGAGVLLAWAAVFWLATWGIASGDWGDCDHLVGVFLWAVVPPAFGVLVLGPIFGIGYLLWRWGVRAHDPEPGEPTWWDRGPGSVRPPERRWRVQVKGWSLVISRRRDRR
jgi:hypothetical protein